MMPSILLVEDEADLRLAVSVRLRSAGFRCETASDGKDGLEKVARHRPDLVIADLLMPVMDGYEFIRILRADPNTADIPIVVLTALTTQALASHQADLRDVPVLQKPFDAKELLDTIHALLTTGGPRHGGPETDSHRG